MLEIRDLHIQFKGRCRAAVQGIDLTVGDGEIVGLVGESGSGKTVTAMTVAGLLDRRRAEISGSVRFDGEELLTADRTRLREIQGCKIGVVFQEPMSALDPLMRIGPQVEESLTVHTSLPPAERRTRALAAMREADLPDPEGIYRKYPHECSGGMLQRALIAAAVITEPRLLIADEPTTALDVTVQAQILSLLKRLNKEKGTAILFISHDMRVVRKLCTRVAVMQRGAVVETGGTEEVFLHPQAEYTKALIAAIPCRAGGKANG